MPVVTLLEAEYSLDGYGGTHTTAVEGSESGAAFGQFRVGLNDLLSSRIDAAAPEAGRKRPVEEDGAAEESSAGDAETME